MTDGTSVENNLGDFRVKILLANNPSSPLSDKTFHYTSSSTRLVAATGFSDMFIAEDTAVCNIDIQCYIK
jgi:hypothetical protein